MKQFSEIGLNRTGILTAPIDRSQEKDSGASPVSDEELEVALSEFDSIRADYLRDSDSVGSVPIPASVGGIAEIGTEAIQSQTVTVFLDRLGERLAFEKLSVRLYDAFMSKCRRQVSGEELARLDRFRDEEKRHVVLVRDAIVRIGGDPTAQTPSADTMSVAVYGLLQILTDPRTTLEQCVQAVLMAELVDNDGWDQLVKLVKATGHGDIAAAFDVALDDELEHLDHMRRWVARRIAPS